MGTVWMAQQTERVKRLVAVKLIKAGMDSRQVIARFEAESQALALMDHAHIARVLDAGRTSAGRPYFVMDLVKGVPITRYCDERHLTPRQRLELFIPVCHAVQHAHQKGIIHRDLKPSNVVVALYDGKPVPKVIDFGVAKAAGQSLREKTLVTGFGAIIGTLEYMSPEQAEINQIDIDTRSDIYALGVLLYELLTGSPPFTRTELEKTGVLELLRMIREQEPRRPSTNLSTAEGLPTLAANRGTEPAKLTKLMRGELDWIVIKALEKDRNRRYETANGLGQDIERYLADEPVQACPPSAGYRLTKFIRRHKIALVMASVISVALLLVAGSFGWIASDRAARHARTAAGVNQFLERAELLYADNKLPEAEAEVQKARGVLEAGRGDATLWRRVRQWLTDLDTAARLEEIRLEGYDLEDRDRGSADFARVFRAYGIDAEAQTAAEATARVAASRIKLDLVAALGNWGARLRSDPRPQDAARWQRLLAIARAVDSDPWRNRLQAAVEAKDLRTLRELATGADSTRLRTRTLAYLGESLRTAGDLDAAVEFLRKVQRQYPADLSSNSNLALCLSDLKRLPWDEVTALTRAALAARPQSAWAHGAMAYALQRQDRLDEAIEEWREAIRLRSRYSAAHISLGIAVYDQKKFDEAIASYRRAIELEPKNAAAHNNLGNALNEQGKPDEAIAEYRRAMEIDPKHALAHSNLGNALNEQGKVDEAIAYCRKAVAFDPNYAGARCNLGLALGAQGKLDEAIACFRKALELDPKHLSTLSSLGNALHQQGKTAEAIACYRKAIEIDARFAPAHVNLGFVFAAQGKTDEAIACYRKAIELEPKYALAHNDLGWALFQRGKVDEAIACYRRAIELNPKRARGAHHNLGRALATQGKTGEAMACYRNAIELDPKNAGAHTELGNILADRKKLDDAINCDRKAIEHDPKNAKYRFNFGLALEKQGKVDQAIGAYSKAIELRPMYAKAHNNLGTALGKQGKDEEAIAYYRKAVEFDPKYAIAHYNLGKKLSTKGQIDEAITWFRKANVLDPKDADAHSGLGNALCQQKNFDEAASCFRRAIELDPKNANVRNNFGSALDAQGKVDEAVAEYRRAIELDPKLALAHRNLASLLFKQGKLDEAIDWYRRAIALDPKHPRARNKFGVALTTKGWNLVKSPEPNLRDPKRALEAVKEAVELVPQSAAAWRWLGWVQYRAGNWPASIVALEKSCKLHEGHAGDSAEWIVLALTHARLAAREDVPEKAREHHKIEARRRYEEASKQIDVRLSARPGDELGQAIWDFREEARSLIGMKESKK
jgi:tetratricopeptide (TPR) repeat protein